MTLQVLLPTAFKAVRHLESWVEEGVIRGCPGTPDMLRELGRRLVAEVRGDKVKEDASSPIMTACSGIVDGKSLRSEMNDT